jgi:tetratricopeptide (TPR) repeat protein
MALQEMPKSIRDMTIGQLEEQTQMSEEQQQEKLKEFLQQTKETKGVSRQYIQDLYRFFKLWKRHHKEEEDIFQWKFNLWDNTWLGNALQKESTLKELADYLLQKEYMNEAYSLYQKLTDAHSTIAEVYQKAGFICQKQQDYEEAIRLYRHADVLNPDNVWTNRHLAQCHKLEGNLDAALEYYRKVEAVQPENLNVALQIGQCLARMEKYTEALSYFYKVEYLEKSPDNARRAIAWCSFVAGKHEEAMKYYNLLLESPKPKAQDWLNAGHVHFVDKRTAEAITHYRKAQEKEKDHSTFIERFYKDKEVLLSQGLNEEDIRIMLDLII